MKINRFLTALSFIVVLTMVACSDYADTEILSPTVAGDNPSVRFIAENQTSFELEPGDNASFTITVKRSSGSTALNAPLQVDVNTDNSFIVPDKVTFAAGENTADLVIAMSPSAPTGVPLTLELSFNKDYVNPYLVEYGSYKGEVSLLKWVKYATGTYTAGFFESSWEQDLFRAEGTNKYRFYDLFSEGFNYEFKWEQGKAAVSPGGTPNSSGYLVQESGYVHATYGMVSTATDPDPAYSNYNVENETFAFDRQWRVAAGSFGWFTDTYKITQKY